jgi:hypothetical protein
MTDIKDGSLKAALERLPEPAVDFEAAVMARVTALPKPRTGEAATSPTGRLSWALMLGGLATAVGLTTYDLVAHGALASRLDLTQPVSAPLGTALDLLSSGSGLLLATGALVYILAFSTHATRR